VNQANPELASMRSMVEVAVARADVARRARTPDFTAGLSADVKANPVLFWPTASMTLPIWRDKIAAEIAAADAGRQAARSRLEVERIALAAEFAQALFAARAADRMIAYLDRDALANLSRAEDSAEAGVRSGTGGFAPVVELRLMRIDLELERAAAQRDRETALVDLSRLAAAGLPSTGLRAESSPLP
jgi:outer membrane protein TolC